MKDFLKFMLASMVGFILTMAILFFIILGIVASLVSLADKQVVDVNQNTVLHISFDKTIYDRAPKNPFSMMNPFKLDLNQEPGLNEILNSIRKAAKDDRITGIYLNVSSISAGAATIEEIRNALREFKASGKFIIAYAEYYTQMAYYLSSIADKVYLNPSGGIDFKGVGAELFFLKGTLEKLDISVSVIRHGKYKSAVEPFTNEKMSDFNRRQYQAFIDDIWENILHRISESRGIPVTELESMADHLDAYDTDKALEAKLVDGLWYKDQVLAELKNRTGVEDEGKFKSITLAKYTLAEDPVKKEFTRDKIAVIYALGEIIDGKGDELTIGSKEISEAIRKARKNKDVKAIVMRVNSPGGSALASEVIRREAELASQAKPFIVSMGNLAASGGYWISCTADSIFADSTTLTGSIGVFGLIPDLGLFFKNKLGITFDHVYTNENTGFPGGTRPMTDYEKEIMLRQIERIYSDFLGLVARGRGMTEAMVDSVGQGRIWSATDALQIGLIDQIGGLNTAIQAAASKAGLINYTIYELPIQKEPLQQVIDQLTGKASASALQNELGEFYPYYSLVRQLDKQKGILARMPYSIVIR